MYQVLHISGMCVLGAEVRDLGAEARMIWYVNIGQDLPSRHGVRRECVCTLRVHGEQERKILAVDEGRLVGMADKI